MQLLCLNALNSVLEVKLLLTLSNIKEIKRVETCSRYIQPHALIAKE